MGSAPFWIQFKALKSTESVMDLRTSSVASFLQRGKEE